MRGFNSIGLRGFVFSTLFATSSGVAPLKMTGLTAGRIYYLKIYTVTLPHPNNPNRVIGRPGPAIRTALPAD